MSEKGKPRVRIVHEGAAIIDNAQKRHVFDDPGISNATPEEMREYVRTLHAMARPDLRSRAQRAIDRRLGLDILPAVRVEV